MALSDSIDWKSRSWWAQLIITVDSGWKLFPKSISQSLAEDACLAQLWTRIKPFFGQPKEENSHEWVLFFFLLTIAFKWLKALTKII